MTVVMESSNKLMLQTKAPRWGVSRERPKKQQQGRVSAVISQLSVGNLIVIKLHKLYQDQ